MPIEYQSETRDFRLAPASAVEGDAIGLPGVWLTTEESYALLTLFNLAEQLDPGLFYDSLSPLRMPLKRVLAHAGHQMFGFDRKVKIEAPIGGSLISRELTAVREALLNDKTVHLEGVSEAGEKFSGRCQPLAIVFTETGWVLEVGHEDKRLLRFALGSIAGSHA